MAHACNPSTLGGRDRWIRRSRDWDHPRQYGETPSLLKIQKLAGCGGTTCSPSYSGGWGRRISWTWEAQVAVSQDHATALQPGNRVRLRLKTATTTTKRKLHANIPDQHRWKNPQQYTWKPSPATHQKANIPQSSRLHPQDSWLVQHTQINKCDSSHKHS